MKIYLITSFIALSIATLDFGSNPPSRKSVTSSKTWQRKRQMSCRRAKCPNDEDFCEHPKCYPQKKIQKALHDFHDKTHLDTQSRPSGMY